MNGDYLHRADDIDRVLDVSYDNYEIGNPVIMNHRNPTLARFVINSSGTVSLKNFPHLILGLLRPQSSGLFQPGALPAVCLVGCVWNTGDFSRSCAIGCST
jgi:hypothetical protein